MAILVEVPTILRSYTNGARSVVAEGATLGDVISHLDDAYPGIGNRVQEAGQLQRFVNIYVNDEDARFTDGLETPVQSGDVVTILPAVAGG